MQGTLSWDGWRSSWSASRLREMPRLERSGAQNAAAPTRAVKEESHTAHAHAREDGPHAGRTWSRWLRRKLDGTGVVWFMSWSAMGSAWTSFQCNTNLTCRCSARTYALHSEYDSYHESRCLFFHATTTKTVLHSSVSARTSLPHEHVTELFLPRPPT